MHRSRNCLLYAGVAVICGIFILMTFYVSTDKISSCSAGNGKIYSPDAYTKAVRNRITELKSLRLPVNTSILRPFLRIKSYYRLAPRYDLSLCLVEKAMSSIMQSIFCYLYDTEGFTANNRKIHTDRFVGRFCIGRNEVKNTQEKHLIMPFDPSTIFIIRNPISRFLSGFVNKCIHQNSTCYNCKGDVLCAVERFHMELMKMNMKHWDITKRTTGPIKQSLEATHMAPSNWMCDFFEESDRYIFIEYGETEAGIEKTYAKIIEVLRAHGVEKEKLDYIYNNIKERTDHATASSGLKEKYLEKLKASPRHMHLLNNIYHYEYQIFGYDPLR